jgi:tRNA A37 methylthiotransferase MiaB
MSDLILGNPDEINENEEIENEVEFTSDIDYITAAYFALSAVEGMDEMQHGKDSITQRRIRRIKRKALIIIDECLKSLYDEIIEETDED